MATRPRPRMASRKQLQSLKDHFKDVGFQEYPQLNEECKRHFIDCLDGRSLVRLGMCSKAEQRLAAGVPLKIHGIKLSHGRNHTRGGLWETEKVQTTLDGGDQCCIHFKQVGTTVLMKTGKGHLLGQHENAENYKEAVAFFEDLMKKCNYGVEEIVLNMGPETREWAARDGSGIGRFPNVRVVRLCGMDSTHQKFWLKKMPDHLERLSLTEVTSEIAELPQFRNARQLNCLCRCDVTIAQLYELKAVDVILAHAPLITAHDINVFLKRWQSGVGVDGFRKLKIKKIESRVRVEDVLKCIDVLKVEENNPDKSSYLIRNEARSTEYLKFWSNSEGIDAQVVRKTKPSSRIASRVELQSLKYHFKDLGFREYPLLIDDCKRHLMGCLDGRSLGRIEMCSKNEQRLAAETPLKISKIGIFHYPRASKVTNRKVAATFDGGDTCCVKFEETRFGGQDDFKTTVRTEKGRILWILEDGSTFTEAKTLFLYLLKRCRYRVEEIRLDMGGEPHNWAAKDDNMIGRLPNVRVAKLRGWGKHQEYWLNKMPDHLEYLRFDELTPETAELPQVRNARRFASQAEFVTDDQLLALTAVDVNLLGTPKITAHGLNVFLKRWQCGGGVDGFRRLYIYKPYSRRATMQVEVVIEGLDALEVFEQSDTYYLIRNKVRPTEQLRFSECPYNISIESVADK